MELVEVNARRGEAKHFASVCMWEGTAGRAVRTGEGGGSFTYSIDLMVL